MNGSLWNDEQSRPLQHLRIVDLSIMFPGPYLTRILSQYGADVVKVENLPLGDPTRHLKDSALYDLLNQGKRSVGVNLKSEQGNDLVRQLAAEADVFVENFREGVMDGLGLGYADISESNPDLIYMSMRGLSGKNMSHAGHDLNFIATSGIGEWFLESGTPNLSTQFGDIVGGTLMPALRLLVHLANPERTGMHLVANMDEGMRSLYLARAFDSVRAEKLGKKEKGTFGYHRFLDGSEPHSRYYRCKDGQWVSLNAIQEKHWELFCGVIEKKDWIPRMHDHALIADMEKVFLDAPASYWESLTGTRELCLFRVIPWEEHVNLSSARQQLNSDPLAWAGFAPNQQLTPAPSLGADTFAIMHSMGLSHKEIADLMKSGVLHQVEMPKV